MQTLSQIELQQLFTTVFKPGTSDKILTILVDLPNGSLPDSAEWRERRCLAYDWWLKTIAFKHDLGLERVEIYYYENVGRSNNELPATLYHWGGKPDELDTEKALREGMSVALDDVLAETDLIIALTELSATAPLKMLAKKFHFRGATMPGFIPSMIPSLQLDYAAVHERIMKLKTRLDAATEERIVFDVGGTEYVFTADLRFRNATPSSGMFHEDAIVGNLPSGETYIVPYEGERENEPSLTTGIVPVQFGDEIVLYRIEQNRAVEVLSKGSMSEKERNFLTLEPAYGNIAELGHGVLGAFGCTAVGNLLMDEKLGLHVAFGRSEHFGGIVSPKSFNDPANVVHIDRVYVPSLQPSIVVREVVLTYAIGGKETIMRDGDWVV